MASLFISYSRKDIDFARKLTEAFEGQNLDFWIDWEGIPPTVDWWKEIQKGIEEADIFLFLISPDSSSSKVCRQEIEHAVRNGKRLIPIIVRDVKGNEAPTELSHLNWIFFRTIDDFNNAFGKLIAAIKTDYEWVQIHRHVQVRALEWERGNKDNSFLLQGKELKDVEQELVANSAKEPHPTDLIRSYVLKSRQTTDRRRNFTAGVLITIAILMMGLAVYGFIQARLAEERAKNALARQLAAQAQEIFSSGDSREETAVLLAAQSMQLFQTFEASQVLQTNTLGQSISYLSDICIGNNEEGIQSSAFSPNGKYIVSGVFGGLCLWDPSTGKVISRMTHNGYVSAALFSPDSKFIVSGSDDSSIRIWEVASGNEINHIDNGSRVISLDISFDGTKIVSAGDNGIAYVWNFFTGTEIAHTTHKSWVNSARFSHDGRFVVSGSDDGIARVWNADTGNEVSSVNHNSPVSSVAFSPDDKTILSGSEDGIARVWETKSGIEVAKINHQGKVISVGFSPDGNLVISGGCSDGFFSSLCTKGIAKVWDPYTGREIVHMTHDGSVTFVSFSPDGKYAISTGGGTVLVWDPYTGIETARMTHVSWDSNTAFNPDSKSVVSGNSDVRVWSINSNYEIARVTYTRSPVNFAISPDASKIVTGGCDRINEINDCLQGSARVWDANTDRETAHIKFEDNVTSVTFSTDGKYIASGSNDGTARVWQGDTDEEISRLSNFEWISSLNFSPDGMYVVSGGCKNRSEINWCSTGMAIVWETKRGNQISLQTFNNAVTEVLFSPNGEFVAAAGKDELIIWEPLTGKRVSEISYKNWWVTDIAFSDNSKFLAAASSDATVRVWEIPNNKEISQTDFYNYASSVTFSPDGRYVAAGGCDEGHEDLTCTKGSVRVWEVVSGKEIAILSHDNAVVTSLNFSPDGKYIISGSGDNLARIWNIATKNEVARMTHDSWISSVDFSPDSKYAVSGSNDGTIRFWKWQTEDLINNVCNRLTRNLTRAEWKQYIGDALPYQAVCENLPIEPEATATPIQTP